MFGLCLGTRRTGRSRGASPSSAIRFIRAACRDAESRDCGRGRASLHEDRRSTTRPANPALHVVPRGMPAPPLLMAICLAPEDSYASS